jgi:hypothetical protein
MPPLPIAASLHLSVGNLIPALCNGKLSIFRCTDALVSAYEVLTLSKAPGLLDSDSVVTELGP